MPLPIHSFNAVVGFPDSLLVLILVVLSLALIFAGKNMIKAVTLGVVGLIGASIGSGLGLSYFGQAGGIIGAVLGFILGGLLGLLFLVVGVGVAFGYMGYLVAYGALGNLTTALMAGAVMFVIGVVLSGKVLKLVGAFLGGLPLLNVLLSFGVGFQFSVVIAVMTAVAGLVVQNRHKGQASGASPQGIGTSQPQGG